MRRIGLVVCALFLVGLAGTAAATPVSIDIAGPPASSVAVTNVVSIGWTSLAANLSSQLGSQAFVLDDGETAVFEFFTLIASGIGVGTADINATLAFDVPSASASGSGDVGWATVWGQISAGYLYWDPATIPDVIVLTDGNRLRVDFENGLAIVGGNSATVHAYVTNLGGAVPDPGSSFLLLCLGGLGLGAVRRRWR